VYAIEDNIKVHIEIIVPNPITMKRMNLVDIEYYPVQKQDGEFYEPSEQPTKMIVSEGLSWALPAQAEEMIDKNCLVSTRTPNQFWCFGTS